MSAQQSRDGSFFESLPQMSKKKATKYLMYGIVIAIVFGTIMMTSKGIADNASSWENLQNQRNQTAYWNGEYGYQDYLRREQEIDETRYWMEWQEVIVVTIGRVGVNVGLVFTLIGFMAFVVNDTMDPKIRWLSLVLAGVILTVMMFTIFFSQISVEIS